MARKSIKYIDLFAGCGGLSVGLERAGFELAMAIEKSDMACETFYHNLIKPLESKQEWKKYCALPLSEQAKNRLVVNTLRAVLDDKGVMNEIKEKNVDVIVGGPPCQGFSLAGRRNPKDARNQLPWQFIEFVEKIQPKMVLMENVVGMSRDFTKHNVESPFSQLCLQLQKTGIGYEVQPVQLNAMHYGIPQHRPRVMLLGLRKDIAKKMNLYFSNRVYKSEYDNEKLRVNFERRPEIVPEAKYFGERLLRVRDACWDIGDRGYGVKLTDIKYSEKAANYARILREGFGNENEKIKQKINSKKLSNQILRKHNDLVIERFRLYQYLKANDFSPKLLNFFTAGADTSEKEFQLNELKKKIKFPAKSPDGKLLAENLEGMRALMERLATKKHSQRPIDLGRPAPTMVTIADDFVHPVKPRVLTVREMARIQSFPDAFEFRGKETTGGQKRKVEVPQYTQVGNAVPPLLAYEVGKNFMKILRGA